MHRLNSMDTATIHYSLRTVLLVALSFLFARPLRTFLKGADLNGPPPPSWLAGTLYHNNNSSRLQPSVLVILLLSGNLPSFICAKNVGDADAVFVNKYDLAFRIKGIFNVKLKIYLHSNSGINWQFP